MGLLTRVDEHVVAEITVTNGLVAHFTLVQLSTGMRADVFVERSSLLERFTTEFAHMKLLSAVNRRDVLTQKRLKSEFLAAQVTSIRLFAGVSLHVQFQDTFQSE